MMRRVTEVLRDAGLMNTAHFNEEARERGTAVHLACQYHDEKRLNMDTLADSLRPYLDQYIDFHLKVQPIITGVECVLDDECLGVVGHCDRLMIIDESLCVVDLKTGAPQPWHGVQLAGYAMMLDGFVLRRALYLTPTAWQLKPYNDRRDFERFRAALIIAETRKEWNL